MPIELDATEGWLLGWCTGTVGVSLVGGRLARFWRMGAQGTSAQCLALHLQSIALPPAVKVISSCAFAQCTSLATT